MQLYTNTQIQQTIKNTLSFALSLCLSVYLSMFESWCFVNPSCKINLPPLWNKQLILICRIKIDCWCKTIIFAGLDLHFKVYLLLLTIINYLFCAVIFLYYYRYDLRGSSIGNYRTLFQQILQPIESITSIFIEEDSNS